VDFTPSIIVQVAAGDIFNVRVNTCYNSNDTNRGTRVSPFTDFVAALAPGIGGIPVIRILFFINCLRPYNLVLTELFLNRINGLVKSYHLLRIFKQVNLISTGDEMR